MDPLQRRPGSWYNKLDALFQLVAGIKNLVQKWRSLTSRSDAVSIFLPWHSRCLDQVIPVRDNGYRCAYSAGRRVSLPGEGSLCLLAGVTAGKTHAVALNQSESVYAIQKVSTNVVNRKVNKLRDTCFRTMRCRLCSGNRSRPKCQSVCVSRCLC